MRSTFRSVGICAIAAACLILAKSAQPHMAAAEPPSPVELLLNADRPLVIAHRGYSQFAPENTLPAFQLAKEAGADLIELDYHHTMDGIPVVIHDSELNRTTDAKQKWQADEIRVSSKTAQEVQLLEAGKWFGPQWTGTRVPLLKEALNEIQNGGVTLIEQKGGDAATCVTILREGNLINEVVVQSFDWDYLRDFHQLEPRQVLGALGPPRTRNGRQLNDDEKILDQSWIDQVRRFGARILVWNKQITREGVDYAHRLGLKVWVYTIDDPIVAERLLDQDIDGIISNNPSMIWRTFALRFSGSQKPPL